MKRGLFIVLVLAMFVLPNVVFATGTASVTSAQRIAVVGQQSRIVLTIAWTDDNAGTTLAIDPATYGITGWYLYSAETNPGAGPPTDNYDITLVDADAVDLAGATLMNRDTTSSELVNIGTATHGFPIIRGSFTFTIAAGTAGASSGTCILTFVAN